jgi:hypothetical protein
MTVCGVKGEALIEKLLRTIDESELGDVVLGLGHGFVVRLVSY